ncbi:roadblock/LC7 domain-containing protein [Streptomyces sp. NBC_01218]|uniref:roadblock/LC7 domain-containing protein n=1 Tax=unclassified Streptomyces TaxID=2593676 RepID=UPI0023B918E4|nr:MULTISPECIES: roadblock/LC7 domain-containing protein [unclassified Streptomyces]WEH39138.1 roadblock/LC7 domain-containing protein [Streptomyces sp. AM 2-1-1]WSQ50794.1 roadblock/LC7 domain-containing protein [Streptomyces sp. NBC_01218]
MTGTITRLPDLGWMLRPLTEIPGVRHAVVVSEDGLRLGHASAENLKGPVSGLSVAEAESLSAACAAMTMTGRSTTTLLFGSGVGLRQLMLESDQGFVLFTHAGVGAHLGVATDLEADVGLVAQQMQLLVAKIGAHLSSLPRDQATASS